LSNQDALEKAIKLLNLMKAAYRPMTKEEYKRIQNEENKQRDREGEDDKTMNKNKKIYNLVIDFTFATDIF
jgi:hypothetical protein